jgi:hypothetical protein
LIWPEISLICNFIFFVKVGEIIRIEIFYFSESLIEEMGQQLCSIRSQDVSKTLSHLAFDETEIPTEDDDDFEESPESRFDFLKTEVVASWNILDQTTQ